MLSAQRSVFVPDRLRLCDSRPCLARRASGLSKPVPMALRVYRGPWRQTPNPGSLEVKNEHGVQVRTRRVEPACCESMVRSSKPTGCPHSGTGHLVRNFPFSIKYLYPLVNWIGHINLIGRRIDSDRSRVVKLAVATTFAAPNR